MAVPAGASFGEIDSSRKLASELASDGTEKLRSLAPPRLIEGN